MPFNYTVSTAISEAGNSSGISASIITSILGEASASQSHAKEHMKSEDFWTTQRTVGDKSVGSTTGVDAHMKSKYKKRNKHSMFDSPVSAVEAVTAALNSEIGVLALTSLQGNTEDDGIDLYSRTAALTMGSTKQINRTNPSRDSATPGSMNQVDAEYVVVCLRKKNNVLIIASAYPVEATQTAQSKNAGKDWYQSQKNKNVIRSKSKKSSTIVNW